MHLCLIKPAVLEEKWIAPCLFFSLPKQMIFKISRKNWKHDYLMQTSIMEMNDKNVPLQENHLFMVLTLDNVQIVALGENAL